MEEERRAESAEGRESSAVDSEARESPIPSLHSFPLQRCAPVCLSPPLLSVMQEYSSIINISLDATTTVG